MLLIAVDPARYGEGLGAAMMAEVERTPAAPGGRDLLVGTSGLSESDRTRSSYRFIGYDEEGRIRGRYQAGEDKAIFRRTLAARDLDADG